MSPILDQYGRQIPGSKTREIKRLAGRVFPDMFQGIKDKLGSIGVKGFDLLKNAFKGPTTYNQLELNLKPPSAFQQAMDLTKPQGFRPAGALSGLGGSALRVGAPAIAGGYLAGMAVDSQRTGKEKGFTSGRGEGRRGAVETGGGGQIPVVTYADGSRVPGISNNGDQVEQGSAIFNQHLSNLETINRMRQELDQARAAQLARAERRPGVDQQTPPQIVPDDPIAPPVEPTAPIDYMGALGAEMKPASPSTDIDDLKARYRAALLDTNVNSMQALRNAEDVLGIEYAQGKYYFDSGRVDANGNPIPVELKDEQRRQLKNFEITPTELQLQGQLSENPKILEELMDNEEIYDETVGSNATKMPKYPLFTGESPVISGEQFDFADVAAAMSDLGISFLDYHRDLPNIKFNY